jgi:hypothetical protein
MIEHDAKEDGKVSSKLEPVGRERCRDPYWEGNAWNGNFGGNLKGY